MLEAFDLLNSIQILWGTPKDAISSWRESSANQERDEENCVQSLLLLSAIGQAVACFPYAHHLFHQPQPGISQTVANIDKHLVCMESGQRTLNKDNTHRDLYQQTTQQLELKHDVEGRTVPLFAGDTILCLSGESILERGAVSSSSRRRRRLLRMRIFIASYIKRRQKPATTDAWSEREGIGEVVPSSRFVA